MPSHQETGAAPELKLYLNLANLADLPADSSWCSEDSEQPWRRLQQDGFCGVQLADNDPVPEGLDLPYCGQNRINQPADAEGVFRLHKERGDQCVTLHVGWGMESDDDMDRLVEAVLTASDRFALPAYIETHRATITQDMWRTVQLTNRFPEVRFNGDFSHYYCGQEMVYGDIMEKLDFMQPIFDRVRFMHGRISSPGCMQMPVDGPGQRPTLAVGKPDYLEHFKLMWTRAMNGFLKSAQPGDFLVFAPEILSPKIYYARVFPDASGGLREESDRYAQALIYNEVARECFQAAQAIR